METKSTFAILFVAQKGKLKTNGRAPILARITINAQMVHFSTRLDIEPERWSGKEGRTFGKTHEEKDINSMLDDLRALVKGRYNEMITRGEAVTAEKIKSSIFKVDDKAIMLLGLFDQFNDDYKQMVDKGTSYKTYTRYLLTRNRLAEFMLAKYKVKDIPLTEINLKFVNDFFIYLRTNDDNGHNYHMKFIQRLRTVYNVAKNNGWVQADPFANFKMHFEKTDRGYLTNEELKVIMTKTMPSARLELVRDLFVFSCYTGISYIDLKELKKSEVVKGDDGNLWIDTDRIKTGVDVKVPLLEIPLAIMNKYADTSSRERLFDIPSNQKVNDYLKEIGAMCGIDKPITFGLSTQFWRVS